MTLVSNGAPLLYVDRNSTFPNFAPGALRCRAFHFRGQPMMGIDDESSGLDHGDLQVTILKSDPVRDFGAPQSGLE